MLPRDTNSNRGVSAKEYSVCIIQRVVQYYSVVFSIIKYCEFSDIKELVNQVFSPDRQLAHGIAVGTTRLTAKIIPQQNINIVCFFCCSIKEASQLVRIFS